MRYHQAMRLVLRRIRKRAQFSLYVSFMLSFAQIANASPCELKLSVNNVSLTWSNSLPVQQITFTVRKLKTPPCEYAVTFSKGGAGTYDRRMTSGAAQLRYQLYKDASLTNILRDAPDITSTNDFINGNFGVGSDQTATRTYFIDIPGNLATSPTLKPPGAYGDTFIMRIYDKHGNSPSNTPDDSASVTLTTTIPRITQLSLVASGSGFDPNSTTQTLNFGTLTTGATRGLDLRVLSNAGYQVTFASQNNGVLRHASSSVTTTVPYTITVNGQVRSLAGSASNPVLVASGSGQTGLQGSVSQTLVTIGSIEGQIAGSYSDYITVTAASLE